MKRKPQKVRSIAGQHEPDVITQADLRRIAELQAAEWIAASNAHKANHRIQTRLLLGASVEPGPLTFDRELKMVRREKVVGE